MKRSKLVPRFKPIRRLPSFRREAADRPVSLRQILEEGYIIHAHVDHGLRVVSLEHPESILDNGSGRASGVLNSYYGSGPSIELALRQACLAYRNDETYATTRRSNSVSGPARPASRLDGWLAQYDGTLRSVQDEDGNIICRLEGVERGANSIRPLFLEGVGANFRQALAAAFGVQA